jgi:hypothetical protein
VEIKNKDIQSKTNKMFNLAEFRTPASHSNTYSWLNATVNPQSSVAPLIIKSEAAKQDDAQKFSFIIIFETTVFPDNENI